MHVAVAVSIGNTLNGEHMQSVMPRKKANPDVYGRALAVWKKHPSHGLSRVHARRFPPVTSQVALGSGRMMLPGARPRFQR